MKGSTDPAWALRSEVVAAGLDWKAVRAALPDWADDIGASNAGILELKGFCTRHFGLDIDFDGRLQKRSPPKACFKATTGTDIEELSAARAAATACARIISRAVDIPFRPLPREALTIRRQILYNTGKRWVDLESLADYAWLHGIPVMFLPNIPTTGRKMDGMVTEIGDRPAVIIAKNTVHPDWALFILAHELGHIAQGHLDALDCSELVDGTVSEDDFAGVDYLESEANIFASTLLNGNNERISFTRNIPDAVKLASIATSFGYERGVSPGHVILNVVNNTRIAGKKLFALGMAALRHLPKDLVNEEPAETLRVACRKYINQSLLKDDSIEYLEAVMNWRRVEPRSST